MRKLFQKNHGVPGAPMSGGLPGIDGTSGNNIYIGYINEFFENAEILVDNLVRVAQRDTSFYTGVFKTDSHGYILQEYNSYDPNGNFQDTSNLNVYHDLKNNFLIQKDSREYVTPTELFSTSFDENDSSNRSYTKVDFDKTGKNPDATSKASDAWNTKDASWLDADKYTIKDFSDTASRENVTLTSDTPYPYDNPSVYYDRSTLIRPGKNTNRNSQGFDLFSVTDNGHTYTFSDSEKSLTYDASVFPKIKDSSTHSIDSPTVEDIIDYDTNYIEGQTIAVDFLKTKPAITETVYVADHLADNIKAGDIIYFYTDKEQFGVDNMIHYMVYITPELEGCDLNTLVNAASVTDPFTFKYMSDTTIDGNDYVYTISNVVSGFYKDTDGTTDASYVNAYGENFTKLLSYMSNSAINVGILSKDSAVDTSTNELIHLRSYLSTDANSELVFSAEHDEDKGTININPTFNDTPIPLKIKNMFIRKNNNGNIESLNTLNPEHIYINGSGHAYTMTEDDYDPKTNIVYITDDKILNDIEFTDYECGFNVVCYKKSDAHNGYAHAVNKTKLLRFKPANHKSITLKKEYGDETVYDILFWIRENDGVTIYADHVIFEYQPDYSRYAIVSEVTPVEEEQKDLAVFENSGLSADYKDGVITDIYLPNDDDKLDQDSVRIFINSTEISLTNPIYESSWYVVNDIEHPETSPRPDTALWRINAKAQKNIPDIVSSSQEVVDTTEKYIREHGANSIINGCDVFNNLLEGIYNNTTERTVTITVLYTYNGKEQKSYYKLTQPGYTEKRRVPKVALNLRKDLDFLERSNNVANGVLCNQFQFFVDIDITDFSRECWGSYVDDDKITLDLEIKNAQSDYDIIKKYSIQNAKSMSTLHIKSDEPDIDFANNNYVRIKTTVIDNTVADVCDCTQHTLSDAIKTDAEVTETLSIKTLSAADFPQKEAEQLNTGLNDEITISLKNIHFADVANGRKFRICVNVEFGNPLFSKLFFRFYVSNMVLHYDNQDFYVGTDNLAYEVRTGTMNYEEYMYASNTLNAFICPVSYIAVPEQTRWITTGPLGLHKQTYDDPDQTQIRTGVDKYVPEIERVADNKERNAKFIEQRINWFDFRLYKKYFQDNIQSMNIEPLDVLSLNGIVSPDDIFSKSRQFADIDTTRRNRNYMAVAYSNDMLYYVKTDKDVRVFPYPLQPDSSTEQLYASRYNQAADPQHPSPIYTTQHYAYEIRNTQLQKSVSMWNKEFQTYGTYNQHLFDGHLSSYGNGYEFLDSVLDEGQYDDFGIFGLDDTVAKNEPEVFTTLDVHEFDEPDIYRITQPLEGRWYESPLVQVQWRYPQYVQDSRSHNEWINAYDLVTCSDYRAAHTRNGEIDETINDYTIPYNVAYSIYPRCAYDYDNDNVIIFMLRCPSVMIENNYKFNANHNPTDSQHVKDLERVKQPVAK